MEDAERIVIEKLQSQIADLDRQLGEKKRMVNLLCQMADQPPIYADADQSSAAATLATLPDEYYGKRLATAIRMVLEKRKAAGGSAMATNDIYDELLRGGYDFQASSTENASRGLYAALSKNTTTFHKLKNGMYGLLDWYDNVKSSKSKPNGGSEKSEDAGATDEEKPLHEELQDEVEAESAESAEKVKAKAR